MTVTADSIQFQSGTMSLQGYLARPEGAGPFPGVVVIHEVFGLNENIKEITRRFAEQGYVALGVDLYTGRFVPLCIVRIMTGMLTHPSGSFAVQDLTAALDFLNAQPGVDQARVGAIGFCMGGGLALAWGTKDKRLKAVAPFYGVAPRPIEEMANSCPVVGSYPEKDFTTGGARKMDTALDGYKIPHDIKFYPDSKHSFFNDKGPNYNEAAATDSWQRVLTFFREHVG